MLTKLKKLSVADWRFMAFIALLVGAPLSKYPSIAVPLFNFPSFRIGLYQLIAALFIILCIKPILKIGLLFYLKNHKLAFFGLISFLILNILSVFWAIYIARSTLLAVSVSLLIMLVLTSWWFVANEITSKRGKIALKALLYAGVFYGIIALGQLIIFTLTNETLGTLCLGCKASVFGFPRINGLAAEPQFLANAMLPFIFASIYSLAQKPTKLGWATLVLSVSTVGLTFSRGAYLALTITLFVIAILLLVKKLVNIKQIIAIYSVILFSVIGSLLLLITSSNIRYSQTPNIAYETLSSIVEHLSLGIINLPEHTVQPVIEPTPVIPSNNQPDTGQQFVSPGLIEASSQERLGAADLALTAWRYNILTLLFGVGIGNLGPFVVSHIDPNAPNNLTVYIYYVLVLAELGLIGLVALLLVFAATIKSLIKHCSLKSILVCGLLTAFVLQYLFFGSYINVVYIWLWLGIALGMTSLNKISKIANTGYNKPRKKLNEK